MRVFNVGLVLATMAGAASPSYAQVQGYVQSGPDGDIIITPSRIDVITVTDQRQTQESRPESIDLIPADEARVLVHPAEAINAVAGVNIHRGSGQEHLTAIRSPVLTGGAGAGSFLYLENNIPLRAAGFANVNGLFEAGTEFARQIEVFKGPGPAEYGSNAVHGLINVVTPQAGAGSTATIIGSSRGYGRITVGQDLSDAFRVSLSLAHDDGFRDESGFDQQKAEARYTSISGCGILMRLPDLTISTKKRQALSKGHRPTAMTLCALPIPIPKPFATVKITARKLACHVVSIFWVTIRSWS